MEDVTLEAKKIETGDNQDEDDYVEPAPKRARTRSKPSSRANTRKGTKAPNTRKAQSRSDLESNCTNTFDTSTTQHDELASNEVTVTIGDNTTDATEVKDTENNTSSLTNNDVGTKPKRRVRQSRINDGEKWLEYLTRLDEEKERKQRESELEYIRKSKLRQERYREQQLKYAKSNSKARTQ